MGTPATQRALARAPVAALLGAGDRRPDRLQLALGGEEVLLVGGVAEHLAVAEVDQLEHPRQHATGAPDHQGVELHLEQRPCLERLVRRPAGLVVDDADLAGRGDVEPVDEAAQQQLGLQQALDVELSLGRLETGRILQGEVALQGLVARGEPGTDLGPLRAEHLGHLGLDLEELLPGGLEEPGGPVGSAVGGGQVEEVLEHLVHDRAAHGVGRGGFGQPVDGPEPVEQRTAHEVAGSAR